LNDNFDWENLLLWREPFEATSYAISLLIALFTSPFSDYFTSIVDFFSLTYFYESAFSNLLLFSASAASAASFDSFAYSSAMTFSLTNWYSR
jgi:hypothetical protein